MKEFNKRILSALLALLLLVNSCPVYGFATDLEDGANTTPETVQATEAPATEPAATEAPATEPPATEAPAAPQRNPAIGRVAKISGDFPVLWKDPTNADPATQVSPNAGTMPAYVKIVDVYQFNKYTLLYKLEAAEGTWPAAYQDYRYMDSANLTLVRACATCGAYECAVDHAAASKPCDKCGLAGCTAAHTNWCATCKKDDCGIVHSAQLESVPSTSAGTKEPAKAEASVMVVTLVESPGLLTAIADPKTSTAGDIVGVKAYPALMEVEAVVTVGTVTYYQLKAHGSDAWPDYYGRSYEHYWLPATQLVQVCPTCGEPGCDGNHQPAEVPTVSHPSGVTVSSADGFPEGAKLEVSVPSIAASSDVHLYDIKILKADGTEWQPIDEGKTVTISIPVDTSASYVDVVHFIDYAPAMNGNIEYVSTVGASDAIFTAFAEAISASNREGYVAVDAIKNVKVNDGFATFQTNSFSIYKWSGTDFSQVGDNEKETNEKFDNSLGNGKDNQVVNEYYATKDHLFKLTTTTIVSKSDCAFSIMDSVTVTEGSIQGTFTTTVKNADLTDTDGGFWDYHDATVVIPETAAPGETIVVRFKGSSYTFYLLIHIVENYTVDYQSPFVEVASNMPASVSGVTDGDPNKELVKIPTTKPVPVDGHYEFVGWNTQADGNGEYYEAGRGFNPMTSMTLYAIWYKANSIVNYDTNGGEGEYEKDIPVTTGNSIVLPEGPSRANYEFLGWSSSQDGEGTIYKAGDSYKVNQDVTLYAIWGVKLDVEVSGGTLKIQMPGEFSTTDLDKYKDDEGNLLFTNKGTVNGVTTYEATVVEGALKNVIIYFDYDSNSKKLTHDSSGAVITFNDFTNQSRATINADDGIDQNTTITFAATDKNTYVISFNSNGGTAVTSVLRYQGNAFRTTDNDYSGDPLKSGYTFGGWYKNTALTDGPYTELTGITSNVTLYAKWNKISYSVTFNSNGGTAVESITGYTVESKNVSLPVPSRSGYIFTGWKVTVADGNWTEGKIYSGSFSSMYGNVTLTAQWNTTVSATIDNGGSIKYGYKVNNEYHPVENGSMYFEVPVDSYPNVEIVFTPAADYIISKVTKNNTEIEDFELNADGSYTYEFGAAGITGPTAIVVNTVPANHKVTYNTNSGSAITEATVAHGGSLTLSTDTVKTGYAFKGWYLNADFSGEAVTALSNITADMTVYAKWEAITYTLRLEHQYENKVDSISFTVEQNLPTELPAPERTGYTFDGWFADAECTGTAYAIQTLLGALVLDEDHQMTVYAKWSANKYKITFVDEDGTELQSSEVAYNEMPAYTGEEPTKAATAQYTYTFDGWTTEVVPVVGEATYTAKFKETLREYTVKFVDEDGTVLQSSDWAYGATPSYSGVRPEKPATAQYTYTFDGWTTEVVPVVGEATYTVKFAQTVNEYTVKFVNEDGTVLQSTDVAYGTTPAYTGETPTKAADDQYTYTFDGWNAEIVPVTGAVTYTATYSGTVNKYTITFVNEDGTELQSGEVAYGEMPVYTGETPTKAADERYSYTFSGWSPALNPVSGEQTYTATYSESLNSYRVIYKTGGETAYGEPTGDAGTVTAVVDSTVTVKTVGWSNDVRRFVGWNADADGDVEYKPGDTFTMPTHDVTLTAVWETLYTVKHLYKYNNAVIYSQEYKEYASAGSTIVISASNPLKKDGYICKDGENVITQLTITVADNGTSEAVFNYYPVEYTITYDLAGGLEDSTNPNPTTYCVETETFQLAAPVKDGYTFIGWTGTDLDGITAQPAISKGSTGDRTYTANWQINSYKVNFALDGVTVTNGDALGEQSIVYNKNVTLPEPIPVNPSYDFQGWATEQEGAVVHAAGAVVTVTEDVTFYAIWVPLPNTVTYKFQGVANPEIKEEDVAHDTEYTIATPAISGYVFNEIVSVVGKSGTGYTVTGGKFIMPLEPVTVTLSYTQTKLIISQSGVDASDTVFYSITGKGGSAFNMTVAVSGSGSVEIVGIPVGEYTVEETKTGWTLRYGRGTAAPMEDITVSTAETEVSFSYGEPSLLDWLFGEGHN